MDQPLSISRAASNPPHSRIDILLARIQDCAVAPAIVWAGHEISYSMLAGAIDEWIGRLGGLGIGPGQVVAVVGDFSPQSVAALLALFARRCIAVPLAAHAPDQKHRLAVAQVTAILTFGAGDSWTLTELPNRSDHPLICEVQHSGCPAIILFSSGSTGESKASLHDVDRWIERLQGPGTTRRTISFLLFDHGGGFNTLMATLITGGAFIVPSARDVDSICRLIEEQRVELLPTSPTFLRLLLIAEAHLRFNLSSLKLITYGTEPMHDSTLRALRLAMPWVRLKQTYGLTELGAFRTKSRGDDSLWVAIGGNGLETRVAGNLLYIRARAAMLGYLNADNPFDQDGWYCTGDIVDVEDGYFLIRGRANQVINVGGQKVHPVEVENVLMELENVLDATVTAKASHITGQLVVATVNLFSPEETPAFSRRAREFCLARLEPFKVPAVFQVEDRNSFPVSVKKNRRSES